MKNKFSVKKIVICAAAICCIATISVFASGVITQYTTSSYKGNAFTQVPSSDTLQKDIGFSPKVIGSFSNGYTFKEAEVASTNGQSDEGENLSSFKELSTEYTDANGQRVSLTSYKTGSFLEDNQTFTQSESYNNISLAYVSQVYEFVPEDYQLTEADKEAQANGSITFSYGSDEVETKTMQSVSWTDGDIDYMLMTESTALTSADLFTMAHELIDMN